MESSTLRLRITLALFQMKDGFREELEDEITIDSENYKRRAEPFPRIFLWLPKILWQNWTMEAYTQQCSQSGLKVMVRLQVGNETTKNIIWHARHEITVR